MNTQQGYILIVEDVPDILKLLEATLTFKGYRVVTSVNGQEALDAIQRERPALVITDIMMPRLDGFGLVHRLRINPETREIPVIFLTATYVALEDKAFALNIGATRFIEKPVNFEHFLGTVEELMTKDIPAAPSMMSEAEFYEGYRQRLERKLQQKITQITRDERLLETIPEEEKSTFRASLQLARNERDEIQRLLAELHARMAGMGKSEETK
ncbi:MAG TPA: response regulator [Anaerolineales bacterium]|nr:response regulator [Anaerolineales bacterium]